MIGQLLNLPQCISCSEVPLYRNDKYNWNGLHSVVEQLVIHLLQRFNGFTVDTNILKFLSTL